MNDDRGMKEIGPEWDLQESPNIPASQRNYVLQKNESAILDAVLRGHDIENELNDALRRLYDIAVIYNRRRWFAIYISTGVTIVNPNEEDSGFPNLTSLLKCVVKNDEKETA